VYLNSGGQLFQNYWDAGNRAWNGAHAIGGTVS